MIKIEDQEMIEAAVLGSLLRGKNKAVEILPSLRVGMFISGPNRALFKRIEWVAASDLEFDDILLRGQFDYDVFGADEDTKGVSLDYINMLRNEYQFFANNIDHWVERLVASAQLRKIAEITNTEIFGHEDIEQRLDSVRSVLSVNRVGIPPIENYDDYEESEDLGGVPTGFEIVDGRTDTGGLPLGQLTIVAAYAKGGKTASMVQIADAISLQQYRVLYATFADLNKAGIAKRRLKNYCGWSKRPEYPGPELERYKAALARLRGNGYFEVFDATNGGVTVEALVARVNSMRQKPEVLCVDYAQELDTSKRVKSDFERYEATSKALRDAAQVWNIPIVVGSQITEGKDGGRDITKGSRVWEERAGLILKLNMLTPEAIEKVAKVEPSLNQKGLTRVTTINRFGPPSSGYWVFNSTHVKFDELVVDGSKEKR